MACSFSTSQLPKVLRSCGAAVLLAFSLANVLRATTAWIFSTSQLPKVLRQCGVFCFFPWKCASRHNGVHFFISYLASWLRTRGFSEPTFRPSGATNHRKNIVFRDFPTFRALAFPFFSLFPFSDLTLSLLRSSLFSSSLFSSLFFDPFHLCFSSVHIVGSLASKLPSINIYIYIYRRKFRSQTSDNMDRWKAEQGRGRDKRQVRREKIRRKKMQMREKVGMSRFTVFFQWFVAPEGRKVGSLKRRVRSQLARWEMEKCTPLWREAHFQVKSVKNWRSRTTFWSCDVEKVHAVVARSTFPSENAQNTPGSDHFLKLRCRKSARRCGAKHISKSKCTKHTRFGPLFEVAMSKKCTPLWCEAHISKWKCTKHTNVGPLLEVEMSKKCTPLWREAHFQVKMYKTHHSRTTFWCSDVEKVSQKCTPLWREAHFQVKSVKNWGFWAFFDVKMSKK